MAGKRKAAAAVMAEPEAEEEKEEEEEEEEEEEKIPSCLPIELWAAILIRLPAEDLIRLQLVCRSWHRLIRSSRAFARSYADRWGSRAPGLGVGGTARFDYFPLTGAETRRLKFPVSCSEKSWEVLASCDGLLLLGWGGAALIERLRVLNPVTGSYKDLLPLLICERKRIREWALVRDATRSPSFNGNRYKALFIERGPNIRCLWYCFDQYGKDGDDLSSRGEWGWKELDAPPLQGRCRVNEATHTGGKLHLLISSKDQKHYLRLLSLDTAKEEFRASDKFKLRPWESSRGDTTHISAWNGSFYYVEQSGKKLRLWELENLDGNLPIWIQRLNVPCNIPIYPLEQTGMKLLVVLQGAKLILGYGSFGFKYNSGSLYVYDMISKEWGKTKVDSAFANEYKILPHVNTLVSLDAEADS